MARLSRLEQTEVLGTVSVKIVLDGGKKLLLVMVFQIMLQPPQSESHHIAMMKLRP